jgi:23S rRNA G2069 N7-methylase RlmK/C1962 C5-methylase RlmI
MAMGMDTTKKKESRQRKWMTEVTEVIYAGNLAEEGRWRHRNRKQIVCWHRKQISLRNWERNTNRK